MKKVFVTLALLLSFIFGANYRVSANDIIDLEDANIEVISKTEVISEFAELSNISYADAEKQLFPEVSYSGFRSALQPEEATTFVRITRSAKTSVQRLETTHPYGTVLFVCEVSKGGWQRGIHNIRYGAFSTGKFAFSGTFNYTLADPNHIMFDLNGHLYTGTTSSGNIGGSVGLGEWASVNASIGASSNYYAPLNYSGDYYY